jgi:hypothetical protein
MRVIVVNSGSSSIKYEVFALDDCASLVRGLIERIGTPEARLKHRRFTDSGHTLCPQCAESSTPVTLGVCGVRPAHHACQGNSIPLGWRMASPRQKERLP